MLGQEPDDVVAAKTGRSVEAVRIKRTPLGMPTARDRRRKACSGRPRPASGAGRVSFSYLLTPFLLPNFCRTGGKSLDFSGRWRALVDFGPFR
jgi:hypothetical protein